MSTITADESRPTTKVTFKERFSSYLDFTRSDFQSSALKVIELGHVMLKVRLEGEEPHWQHYLVEDDGKAVTVTTWPDGNVDDKEVSPTGIISFFDWVDNRRNKGSQA